ncbi:Hypothetical protein R9X50_00158500 [Acrodontium crateriforme]|uniref:Fatty acid hydroxylase domain-containing protein n=1 Tax=Acrodontium crateriforme TaxID=150365 RepID=A0AAQ3M0Z7_9PEZI|nr:Hypothetical protein R9X50_00158500 [Acrodontium crateriforme]
MAQTTTTKSAGSGPNPKDSMKSTWRSADKSTWRINHHILDKMDVHPTKLNEPAPVFAKTDPIPYMPHWQQHILVLVHAFLPILLHQAFVSLTGQNLGPVIAGIYYTIAFGAIAVREVHLIRKLAYKYGYLDGDVHLRDEIPDAGVDKIATTLNKVTGARIAMAIYLTYKMNVAPFDEMADPAWWGWLLVQTAIYPIAIDFWFYMYHRAMHDVPFLWQFHRTHHLTKHPNALMSAYADHVQEFFDIAGIPLLAYGTMRAMGLEMSFYQLWICSQYIAYTEIGGHSGLRIALTPPNPLDPVLKMLRMELVLEDHDLHHRKGWRKSHNYGKQTRVWDRIFGTCIDRIETTPTNVDYVNTAQMPFY